MLLVIFLDGCDVSRAILPESGPISDQGLPKSLTLLNGCLEIDREFVSQLSSPLLWIAGRNNEVTPKIAHFRMYCDSL